MTGNTFGHTFKITTWGESHGTAVGVVVEGVPAGLELMEFHIQKELDRRKPGQSKVSTKRKEADKVEILSGTFNGKTTGTPISMIVHNKDADSRAYEDIKDLPRPGHADYTYFMKYGIRDYRGGGRSSARETIGRVVGGAIAKILLNKIGVKIVAHVVQLGNHKSKQMDFNEIIENVEKTPMRCADLDVAIKMENEVESMRKQGDSIGGIIEVIALNVPVGLGEPVFDKLDADIAKAIMSIGAVKGIEFGVGFKCADMKGSEMNDNFILKDGEIVMETNNAGGILGGISSGMPIVCRVAIKPTPSISKSQKTVDLLTLKETEISIKGRHDPTIPPRAVPVIEAMVAIVIMDFIIRNGNRDNVHLSQMSY